MKLHLHIHEPLHSPSTAQAGPTLLVLHGLLGSASNWGSFGRHFAGRARILVPDLRNHGASPHDGDMSYEALAADILELLDDQDLARVHLLGHSMGGKAALCLACRWPHRVASLLLADITEREFDESEHRWIFDLLQGLDPGRFRTLLEAEAALAGAVSDRGLRQFLLKTLERDPQGPGLRFRVNLPVLSREYSRIRGVPALDGPFDGPALLVRGGRSHYVTESDLPRMRRWLPRLELATVADAGHWLHVDQPRAFQACCARFLGLEEPDDRP